MQYKIPVEELCMKLRPVFGKKMDDIYLRYSMADNEEERGEIEHLLNVLYSKHLSELLDKKVLLEPPPKEKMNGEYDLAIVSYAGKKLFPFNLREQDWMRHVCISGMSGSGKTTLAFHIVRNFIEKKKPFLIFDWKKSFRPILLVDPEVLLFTVGNENISNYFKLNINEPPEGIAPKEWINVLCDLITESFFASYGVHKILLETLDEAFRDFGVYNGSRNYPTWNEIKWRLEDKMEKKRGRESSWVMSAMRIAHILTFGNFGKSTNYKGKETINLNDLLKKKVIFELNALGSIEKKFFCEFILTYIYKMKKARQTGLNDKFDHAIIVDEAHNIFLKEKTHFASESVTDMIYREMREYGTSLVCLDQHISKISDTVSGNSACLIAFQQQLPQDIEAISGLTQLRENKQFFSMLPVGSAIVKLSERHTSPFLIEVPNVELRSREISDYDVKGKMKFIFDVKAIEQGKDEEFRKQLIPQVKVEEKQVIKENKVEEKLKERTEEDTESQEKEILPQTIHDLAFNKGPSLVYIRKKPEVKQPIIQGIQNQKTKEEKIEKQGEEETMIQKRPELSKVQEILYEFAEKKLAMGWHIKQIENTLEQNTLEGNYSILDVFKAIDYAMKKRLQEEKFPKLREELAPQPKQAQIIQNQRPSAPARPIHNPQITPNIVTTTRIQGSKIYKPEQPQENKAISDENEENSEEQFLEFLTKNPKHEYTTTELYRFLGLSARKGNNIKNKLLSEGKIKIEQIKNTKGWKKIIRSA
jgi:hypothetical protein